MLSFSSSSAILVPHQGSVTNPPSITDGVDHGPSTSAPSPASGDTNKADEDTPAADAEAGAEEAAPTPMDVDKEKQDDSKNQTPAPSNQPTPQQQTQQQQQLGQGHGPSQQQPQKDAAPQIDLLLEASKLPLDVAIFNSTRAAGGDDKIRKYLQAVLVVGGTALTPGIAHALESRYGLCLSVVMFFSFSSFIHEGITRGVEWEKPPRWMCGVIKFFFSFLLFNGEGEASASIGSFLEWF